MGTVEESHSLEAAERASPFPNQSGYWRGGALEETVYECLDGRSSCVGGNVTGEYCAPHHHGPLCSLCDQGSYHLSAEEGACTACSVASCWPPAALAALALALLVRSVVRGGHGGGAVSHMSKEVRLFQDLRQGGWAPRVGGHRGWVETVWSQCGAASVEPVCGSQSELRAAAAHTTSPVEDHVRVSADNRVRRSRAARDHRLWATRRAAAGMPRFESQREGASERLLFVCAWRA